MRKFLQKKYQTESDTLTGISFHYFGGGTEIFTTQK